MNDFSTSATLALVLDFAAEQVNQFDDQNDDHHEFEHEGAALVELVHHKAIKVFRGVQFLVYQIFVVRHAYLGRSQLVETGGKHVAEKLYGVIGALGQLVHIQQNGMKFGCGTRQPPPCQHASPLIERGIHNP